MIVRMQRATVCCYSMSSGLTGCGSGMIDFFSVSLDRAFLMSATREEEVRSQRPLLLRVQLHIHSFYNPE